MDQACLDELLSLASQSANLEDGFVSLWLDAAESAEGRLTLTIRSALDEEVEPEEIDFPIGRWRIACDGVKDCYLKVGHECVGLELDAENSLGWAWSKPQSELFLASKAANPDAAAVALLEVLTAARQNAFTASGDAPQHSPLALRNLLSGGYGRIAAAPSPLIDALEQVTQSFHLRTNRLDRPASDPTGRVLDLFEAGFVVASAFAAERVE